MDRYLSFILINALLITDYQLVIIGKETSCTQNAITCEEALKAIKKGWLTGIPKDAKARTSLLV